MHAAARGSARVGGSGRAGPRPAEFTGLRAVGLGAPAEADEEQHHQYDSHRADHEAGPGEEEQENDPEYHQCECGSDHRDGGAPRSGAENSIPSDRMRSALIVDAVRSPMGKRNGTLASVRANELAAQVLTALADRLELDPAAVEDVQMGCVTQIGEQALNVGRIATLVAGWPASVCASTIDRQ